MLSYCLKSKEKTDSKGPRVLEIFNLLLKCLL